MESYHVVATHPTLMEDLGDANTRYDTYRNHSRAISPHAVESPHLEGMRHWDRLDDGKQFARYRHPMNGHIYERVEATGSATTIRVTDLDGHESHFDHLATWIDGPVVQADQHLCMWIGGPTPEAFLDAPLMLPNPPDGIKTPQEIRAWLAATRRAQAVATVGNTVDPEQFSDAEMLDAMYYSVFPNWSPWGVFNGLFYRWRPNGNDPDTCIFEVMLFPVAPDPDNKPAPATVRQLGPDDDWTLATELGPAAKIFQQDSINLPHVQRGLKAQEQQEVVFANYNETKIRHFWENLTTWLEIGGPDVSVEPPTRR
jgi:hypothetical protein